MKREFSIEDDWAPFEIHPKLPQEGTPWSRYFQGMDSASFFRQLDGRGKELGVRFNHQPLMANTHRALLGGEFAREHDRHHAYHDAVFTAYFTDCLNIGDMDVLKSVAASVGLDSKEFEAALQDGRHRFRLQETTNRARAKGVSAAPTFAIAGYGTLTGAQPLETFRTALEQAQKTTERVA